MAIIDHFTKLEQKFVIALLYQIAIADLELQVEELHLIQLLSNYVDVAIHDVEDMSLELIKHHVQQISDDKLKEILFMAWAMVRVDRLNHPKEQTLMRFLTDILDIDFDDFKIYYQSMILPDELTVLDKAILLNLAHYMINADEKVDDSEFELFMIMCRQLNVLIEDTTKVIIPKQVLYQTIFTLNKHVVTRIVEELLLIATIDLNFDQKEYDVLAPILNHFHMELSDIEQKSKLRLQEHMEYYQLFHTQSTPQ